MEHFVGLVDCQQIVAQSLEYQTHTFIKELQQTKYSLL